MLNQYPRHSLYLSSALFVIALSGLIVAALFFSFPHSAPSVSTESLTTAVDPPRWETLRAMSRRPSLDGLIEEPFTETSPDTVKSTNDYGRLPLSFEVNRGQTDGRVKFLARGQGYGLFLTARGPVLSLSKQVDPEDEKSSSQPASESAVLSLRLQGSNPSPRITGVDKLPGKVNYFIGNDPRQWRTDIETYSKVRQRNVYRGIDLVYYGNQQQLEYDFVVAPGADPRRIRLSFEGAEKLSIEPHGDLLLNTPAGPVMQRQPIAYQKINGERREVAANYHLEGATITFELGAYDKTQALIIDPVLSYSTFLGGGGTDQGVAIAVNPQGNAFVTGNTNSTNFPVVGGNPGSGFNDVFVAKLNLTGTGLIYSTHLGGFGDDLGTAISLDDQDNAYVVGMTGSGNFPITPGAFQTSSDTGVNGFLTKLNASGSALAYSTFIGGDNTDSPLGVAVSSDGRAYVVGRTDSTRLNFIPVPRNGSPVYKSSDNGATWSSSAVGLAASAVNAFALQPGNSNIIYAGSNAGVFKSFDAGAIWSLSGPNQSQAVRNSNAVALDPSNPNIVYSAGFNGIYKSVDAGVTFVAKNSGLLITFTNTIVVNPATPTTLYTGTFNGIFKSTNGGDSWTEVRNGFPGAPPRVNEIVIDPTNPEIVYIGTTRAVYKSTNGGALWTAINTGLPASFTQITALAMNPLDPSVLYVGDILGRMFKTVNGGASWTQVGNGLPLGAVNVIAIDPVTPSTIYGGGVSLYKSVDSGVNWSPSNTGLGNSFVTAVTVDPNNPATVYTGTNIGAEAFALRLNPPGSALEQLLVFGGNENDEARGVALDSGGAPYVTGTTASQNFPLLNAFQSARGGPQDAFVAKLNSAGTGFIYSTYLGGSGDDQGRSIAVRQQSPYVVGRTSSQDFPVINSFQPTLEQFSTDAFVTKFNANGTALDFSSYLGGSATDQAFSVALDSGGKVYITGTTDSQDFPVVNPTQANLAGFNSSSDAFVTTLDPSGTSLLYSTYLGGSAVDQGASIAVDGSGNTYVTGNTSSTNFPLANPFQSVLGGTDAFITKISPSADLSVTKIDSRDPVMVGNNLTYTMTVENLGNDPAVGVVLNDTLPAGVTFVSATASQGNCSGSTVLSCSLGDIAKNANTVVTVVVTPQSVGMISNTATVTNSTPDPNPANNSATQETRVSALPSIAGRVASAAGVGTPSVLMTLTGSQSASTTTSASGFYQFPDLPANGNYTVTPARQGFVFHPQSQSFTNLIAGATANFQSVACVFSIAPRSQSFTSSGGTGSVNVTAPDSLCPWTASSDVPWITITSSPTGFGSGTVNFNVAPTASSRSGTLRIAGHVFTVWQELSPCPSVSFLEAPRFPSGPSPRFVAKGDLNNDGKTDLVFANASFSGKVSVVLGNGLGGFAAPLSVNTLGSVEGIALGDFNNDGKLDVAVAVFSQSQNLQILLGDGLGNLTSFGIFNSGSLPSGVTVGDFNGDGKLDLAVPHSQNQSVTIMLGAGTGAFGSPTNISGHAINVVVGDFNEDNKLDLMLGPSLNLALGNGDGTFAAPVHLAEFVGPVVVADFNGDGNQDVAGTTINSGPFITVLLGNGAGGFAAPLHSSTGSRTSGTLVVADFNGDGTPDLGSGNNSFTSSFDVNLHLGNGLGSFTPGPAYVPGTGVRDIVAGDFNSDGKQDLIAADSNSQSGSSFGEFVFFAGTGTGRLIGARSFLTQGIIQEVEALQFDGDGKLDLLVLSSTGVSLLRGAAPGEFADPVVLATAMGVHFESGKLVYSIKDLNRDGKPDLALLIDASGILLRTYLNNGNGGLTPASDTVIPSAFVLDDFNSDGYPDLVSRNSSVLLTLRLGDGTGAFGAPAVISPQTNAAGFISGDFNGDGKADLIGSTISLPCASDSLQILFGDGMGGFSAPALIVVNGSIETMLARDLNGDGRSDLIITNCANKIVVLFSNETGGFVVGPEFSGGPGVPRRIALGDMNGDGKPDLVVSNDTNLVTPSTVSILIGDGAGAFSGLTTHFAGLYTIPVAIGDFDNNGRADLAAGFLNGNHVGIFLNLCPVVFPPGIKFTSAQYSVSEGAARVQIEVSRPGDTSASATVDYKTSDPAGLTNCSVVNGIASARCDYATVVGKLSFAAGESSKTISIPIVDDAYAEGSESFSITLGNSSGIDLGGPALATVTINDNETVNGPNPVDQTSFFVRQHYIDFLGREPDPGGAAAWEAVINTCPAGDTTCDRIHVSSAFFRSPEFQGRGYFIYRFYPVAFGRKPDFVEFIPDLAKVSGFLSDAELEAARVAFIAEFMSRPAFVTKYNGLNDTQYVDTLLSTAQVTSPHRDFWIAALGNGTRTRATVLRDIAESPEVYNKYYNQAFVVMQYFGYLRRDPDALYLNWIAVLDSNPNDYRGMVNGFMNSLEYRFRFGP